MNLIIIISFLIFLENSQGSNNVRKHECRGVTVDKLETKEQ